MDQNPTAAKHQRIPLANPIAPKHNTTSLPRSNHAANDVRTQKTTGLSGTLRVAWRAPLVFGAVLGTVVEPMVRRSLPHATTLIVQRWSRTILRVAGVEVTVKGVPPDGIGLFVSNHRSYVDILALLSCLPVAFLCKREVAAWPLVGSAAARMGAVFVDRGSRESRNSTLNTVAEAVLAARKVVAFPEGTTHSGPGMGPTRPGLFRAAEERGFELFPVVIEYADPDDAWVGDDTLLRHVGFWLSKPNSRVTVSFGSPVRPLPDAAPLHTQAAVERWMWSELEQLNQQTASGYDETEGFSGNNSSLKESGTWSKR